MHGVLVEPAPSEDDHHTKCRATFWPEVVVRIEGKLSVGSPLKLHSMRVGSYHGAVTLSSTSWTWCEVGAATEGIDLENLR